MKRRCASQHILILRVKPAPNCPGEEVMSKVSKVSGGLPELMPHAAGANIATII